MRYLVLAVAALFAALAPNSASAYWEYGHESVAEIAYRNVTPQTRAAIDRLLRRADLLDTPECPARTVASAAVWPDCIKKLGERFSYSFAWHYQDIDVCKPFDPKSACANGNCVTAQIRRDMRLLQDTSVPLRERVQALAFLIHFVGDLHQPLHVGEHHDMGGNAVHTNYGAYAPDRLNLHSVWDGYLAERAISTPPSPIRHYSDAEKARIAAGDIDDWARQSWEISRDSVYPTALGGSPCDLGKDAARDGHLDNDEIAKLVPIARRQVIRGGLRLAKLLDKALG
ncbi:S1/P1 nuclease [Stakelama saccharophila]|uniref:S1/P1 nuclease n=1 Tax=Stakelama saccharophila TaxID=3075605 RepID=A0ABZ0BB23_9SPHN|nr:S1/P1 nuclease [Stakelama sp. W311]WNO54620.1 S1/P1 nuclease [Stakelama sp. W311]